MSGSPTIAKKASAPFWKSAGRSSKANKIPIEFKPNWARALLDEDPAAAKLPYIPAIVAAWDAGYDAILRGAPALVVASAPKEDPNGMVNLTLALSYLELAASSMGLGTFWAGLLQGALLTWPPLQKAMGLPKDHTHHYPMMLGTPMAKYFRLPERKPPKITWKND